MRRTLAPHGEGKRGRTPFPMDHTPIAIGTRTYWVSDEPKLVLLHPEDRAQHLYIVGKTGLGKSTLLRNLILQDQADTIGAPVRFKERSLSHATPPGTRHHAARAGARRSACPAQSGGRLSCDKASCDPSSRGQAGRPTGRLRVLSVGPPATARAPAPVCGGQAGRDPAGSPWPSS